MQIFSIYCTHPCRVVCQTRNFEVAIDYVPNTVGWSVSSIIRKVKYQDFELTEWLKHNMLWSTCGDGLVLLYMTKRIESFLKESIKSAAISYGSQCWQSENMSKRWSIVLLRIVRRKSSFNYRIQNECYLLEVKWLHLRIRRWKIVWDGLEFLDVQNKVTDTR